MYAEKCTGCGQCVMACSFVKTQRYSPKDALLQLLSWEERCLTVPVVCAQCVDAPCQLACSENAISRSHETGAVVVDEEKCTACELCIEACPTNSISIDRHAGVAAKCDLCGGQPACVEVCYPEALRFEERDWAERLAQRQREVEATEARARQELPRLPIPVSE